MLRAFGNNDSGALGGVMMSLLLTNTVPRSFRKWHIVAVHDFQFLFIIAEPALWKEFFRQGKDLGVIVHPVAGH